LRRTVIAVVKLKKFLFIQSDWLSDDFDFLSFTMSHLMSCMYLNHATIFSMEKFDCFIKEKI